MSCKGCGERNVGCHSDCAEYAEYKADLAKKHKARRKQNSLDRFDCESHKRHLKPNLNYWSIFKTDEYKKAAEKKRGYTQCTLF